MSGNQVLIVGAGLAGLACGLHLKRKNIPFLILEASDAPGGRIRTDLVEGYRLDRGFQVFLTAYPEARNLLNYEALRLKAFLPGALIRYQGNFHRVSDPFRDPTHLLETISSPIGSLADKLSIARLRLHLSCETGADHTFSRTNSTLQSLRRFGFSDSMIERFFRPFFGGIFLERDLSTSSENFAFLFRLFASGQTTIPENGMEEIPRQLARDVGSENIQLNSSVTTVAGQEVILSTGERISSEHIVLATPSHILSELLYDLKTPNRDNAVTCLYFGADDAPISEPILVLNGESQGIINNMCVLSKVSANCAPNNKSLISITVLGNPTENNQTLEEKVRQELVDWFGITTRQWQHLRTYRIKHALPNQSPANLAPLPPRQELREGLYVCGDHTSIGSINGALKSGRIVSELVAAKVRAIDYAHC